MLDYQPVFGKKIIETLSEGMYDNPYFLFREYVQNSADAIDEAKKKGILEQDEGQILITIDAESREITFEDNGTGIPKDTFIPMLTNVGNSIKDRDTNKGFRGIGRLGGLGYCQMLRFETKTVGESQRNILEMDARRMHEILADKDENMDAGGLIRTITTTKQQESDSPEKHYFKVSLIGVRKERDELLNREEVRDYLAMVAPVPFHFPSFMLCRKIEKFLTEKNIEKPNEYEIFLNGDQIFKGYRNKITIDGFNEITIEDVKCDILLDPANEEKRLGWYWFCINKFPGVLPKNCWQRCLRLRKQNIQIGEEDCLSNHKKGGVSLWKEDRGNSYFLGEVHATDRNLIPNSRRDYFNRDESCTRFENALKSLFCKLSDLYREASKYKSAKNTINNADVAEKEFEKKERGKGFIDEKDHEFEKKRVENLGLKREKAQNDIKRINKKSESNPVLKKVVEVIGIHESPNAYGSAAPKPHCATLQKQKPGFLIEQIQEPTKSILEVVFSTLEEMLPDEKKVKDIQHAILRKFIKK